MLTQVPLSLSGVHSLGLLADFEVAQSLLALERGPRAQSASRLFAFCSRQVESEKEGTRLLGHQQHSHTTSHQADRQRSECLWNLPGLEAKRTVCSQDLQARPVGRRARALRCQFGNGIRNKAHRARGPSWCGALLLLTFYPVGELCKCALLPLN